jgi:hypothetical protein
MPQTPLPDPILNPSGGADPGLNNGPSQTTAGGGFRPPEFLPPDPMGAGGLGDFGLTAGPGRIQSTFGIALPPGAGFGAGRAPGMGSGGGLAGLLAMRARMMGRGNRDQMLPEQGPGSGAQGGMMPRPGMNPVNPMMRSGMFGMGGAPGMAGGMAGALAALKARTGDQQMQQGQPTDQMAQLMERFQPLAGLRQGY